MIKILFRNLAFGDKLKLCLSHLGVWLINYRKRLKWFVDYLLGEGHFSLIIFNMFNLELWLFNFDPKYERLF